MKKVLYFLLFVALIFVGCGGGDEISSGEPSDVNADGSSNSDSQSSASYETPCGFAPMFTRDWPKDGAEIPSIDFDFTASVNTVGCDTKIEVQKAILYYEDSSGNYTEVGTFVVKSVRDSANPRVWNLSYNLNELDAKSKLLDGYYKVELKIENSYYTFFKLSRSFENVSWILDFSDQQKNAVITCEGCRFDRYIYKSFLLDSQGKVVTEFAKPYYTGVGFNYALDSIWSTLNTGRYTIRFVAISTNAASDEGTEKILRAYGEPKDSANNLKFAWAVDENFVIRKGLLGTVRDTFFVVDNEALEIANLPKDLVPTVYRVGGRYKTHFKFSFDIIESMYGMDSRPVKIYLEAAGYDSDVYREFYSDSIALKKDTTKYLVDFLDTTLSSADIYSIRVKIKDEYQKVYYANVTEAYLLKDFVEDFTLSEFWVPAKIPSKQYDCQKYKCQDVSFLNPNVEYGELLDERDNRVYRTLKVGDQVWMAQNLNYAADSSFCYGNDSTNCGLFGRLYTWNIAVGKTLEECPQNSECDLSSDYIDSKKHVRGICPKGFHVPTDSDYYELGRYLGREYNVETPNHMFYFSEHLLSPYKWKAGLEYVNTSGFTMLPSGMSYADDNGKLSFSGNDWSARYWTSTKDPDAKPDKVTCWDGSADDKYVFLWIHCPKDFSFGLRCVKD